MADIVKLLPDSIANQIAAGEVIQRPASVVKELLENSIDAGAQNIQLIVRDAGATLIQVVDDGHGMSETDARMSLERHATSKITTADDLFRLRTMGFRGEALASIAAVARIEIKTRTASRELGTELVAEASTVKAQQHVAHGIGTTVSVKNLFFNVPARRKFLKTDAVELRHIYDEFHRVALAHPELKFMLHQGDQLVYQLPAANLRRRIEKLMGKTFEDALLKVEEHCDFVRIEGFVGKPEVARRSRGEQFLFVNKRFFRSTYLHTAVVQAFENLLPHGQHPAYFLFLTVEPDTIDVNIHPTKTEIKFADEKALFAVLRSAVKRAIGHFHLSPRLDFEQEQAFDVPPPSNGTHVAQPQIRVNPDYNPFKPEISTRNWEQGRNLRSSVSGWESLYSPPEPTPIQTHLEQPAQKSVHETRQIGTRYVMVISDEGVFVLHQHRAHLRVLFEAFENSVQRGEPAIQQSLFPVTMDVNAADMALFVEAMPILRAMGFDAEPLGKQQVVVRGTPDACPEVDVVASLAGFLDDMRKNKPLEADKLREHRLRSMASHSAIKAGQPLDAGQRLGLFNALMNCRTPQHDPMGRPTFAVLNSNTLDTLFEAK